MLRVLIAEDNVDVQQLHASIMRGWGFEFDLAANGREAVELARARDGAYDICLMDIDMPVMGGLEAARFMRRELRYFPILAVTGKTRQWTEYFDSGIDDLLEKPFTITGLRQKIGEWTEKHYQIVIQETGSVLIERGRPMDKHHAQELRELAKVNLRRVKFFDGPGSSLIVHKNVTNKISHDFNVKRQLMATFLNREPGKPTRCDLYKEGCALMPQTYLTPEEYEELEKMENAELEKYQEPALSGPHVR
ncbi:MAG: response regulator [Deltaproteobacteria bacterium]|nr:response regulator [Candidatus Anaeroferrophillacea bacterium]